MKFLISHILFISIHLIQYINANKCLFINESQIEIILNRILSDSMPRKISNETKKDELKMAKERIKGIPNEAGKPLQINISFYIEDINSISEINMDFKIDFYLQQYWVAAEKDCILYNDSLSDRKMYLKNTNSSNEMTLTSQFFDLFWLPDTLIANAKMVSRQSDLIKTAILQIHMTHHQNEGKALSELIRGIRRYQ